MVNRIRIFSIALAIFFIPISCSNQKGFSPKSTVKIEEPWLNNHIDKLRSRWIENKKLSMPFYGVILVTQDGKPIAYKSYAPNNNDEPSFNDSFCIGSVTKQFVAAGIVRLEKKGLLKRTENISIYFPDLPKWSKDITINHLLTHTSGFFNYTNNPNFEKEFPKETNLAEILKYSLSKSPVFDVGSKYDYSNTNYYLLGEIIKKVSNEKDYLAFLKKEFFNPMGLSIDRWGDEWSDVKGLMPGDKVAPKWHHSQADSAGELKASAFDMNKWGEEFFKNVKITEEEVKALIQKPAIVPKNSNYALGWVVSDKNNWFGHGGGLHGFNSSFSINPEKKVVISILGNCNDCGVNDLDITIRKSLDEGKVPELPKKIVIKELSKGLISGFPAKYSLDKKNILPKELPEAALKQINDQLHTMEIKVNEKNEITFKPSGQSEAVLNYMGQNKFNGPNKVIVEELVFEENKVVEFKLKQGVVVLLYTRKE